MNAFQVSLPPVKKLSKHALICGVSGQDGAYLAKFLLSKGYRVFGSTRNMKARNFHNLIELDVISKIQIITILPEDMDSICEALELIKPDEIYNLSGQSSVGLSFERPEETFSSIVDPTKNFLNAIKVLRSSAHFFNAGSGECFGEASTENPAEEKTIFSPRSPYAAAKSEAHKLVKEYRELHGLFACTGILFNHESPLRPRSFVTQKIIQAALEISNTLKKGGNPGRLNLGNLAIKRDWGWAPDYVSAMWLMLQKIEAEDFVIATGKTHSLGEFVEIAFSKLGCNWKDHVVIDNTLFRPNEPKEIAANPNKAKQLLGWESKKSLEEIVQLMLSQKLNFD